MAVDIDWKYVSTTPGYKSLKKVYIESLSFHLAEKSESLKKFQWVINRAKHYSLKENKPIHQILDEWEKERTYCWNNYYQDCQQPKIYDNKTTSMGINGFRKSYSSGWRMSSQERKNYICGIIVRQQKLDSKKKKPRWSMMQKKRKSKY